MYCVSGWDPAPGCPSRLLSYETHSGVLHLCPEVGNWLHDHLRVGGGFLKSSLERDSDIDSGLSGQSPVISDI